jgi:flagellar biosynthesis/type III secretory pathway chaperone
MTGQIGGRAMLNSSRFNYLIEISQKLILSVSRMRKCYGEFPALIDEEHTMIHAHTYTERLVEICKEKTLLADKVSETFEELTQLTQQLFTIWSDVDCEGVASFPGDLTNCVRMLESIHSAVVERHSHLAADVLGLQISRLQEEVQAFKDISAKVKPKIEQNRLALSGVVKSYQDSTRVLFELAEQAQATYSSQGTTSKSSEASSTIFVRA